MLNDSPALQREQRCRSKAAWMYGTLGLLVIYKGNQMRRALQSCQTAVGSMQLAWSVYLIGLKQMEQLVSHSGKRLW